MLLTWRATVFSLMPARRRSARLVARWRRAEAPRPPGRSGPPDAGAVVAPSSARSAGGVRAPRRAARRRRARPRTPACAPSAIAELPIGEPDRARGSGRRSYGASISCQPRPRVAQRLEGAGRLALGAARTAPRACADGRAQQRRVERRAAICGSSSRPLRRPRRRLAQHDVDRSAPSSSTRARADRAFLQRQADGGSRPPLALREPQQREPGLRLASGLAGEPVRVLGCGRTRRAGGAARQLVVGGAGLGRVGRRSASHARRASSTRVLPGAVQLHELGAADEAMAAERHDDRAATRTSSCSAEVHSCARRRSKGRDTR